MLSRAGRAGSCNGPDGTRASRAPNTALVPSPQAEAVRPALYQRLGDCHATPISPRDKKARRHLARLVSVKLKNIDVNGTGSLARRGRFRGVPPPPRGVWWWSLPATQGRMAPEPSILVLRGAAERGSNGDRPKGRPEGRPSVDGLWGGGGGSAAGGFGSHPAPSHEARRSRWIRVRSACICVARGRASDKIARHLVAGISLTVHVAVWPGPLEQNTASRVRHPG